MAYTPTTWTSGDIITSQKLNKIENGVANNNNNLVTAVFAQPSYFSGSASHGAGFVGYFKQKNNKWCLVSEETSLYWFGNNFVYTPTICLPPSNSGIKVFWAIYAPLLDGFEITNIKGGVNMDSPVAVYDSTGNSSYNGYELTGGSVYADIISI